MAFDTMPQIAEEAAAEPDGAQPELKGTETHTRARGDAGGLEDAVRVRYTLFGFTVRPFSSVSQVL